MANLATDATRCTTSCQPQHLLHLRTAGWPAYVALDPADGATYITNNVDATVCVHPLP